MASAFAVTVTTPPRDHRLLQEHSPISPPIYKPDTSPQRSPYFTSHSDPLQDQETELQHCGLSPRRVHSLPRAWERRPETPYVARNDAQKIWKRVPLGVVGANDGQKWRKETSRLNTRSVKRLRVTPTGEDEDKENVNYVGSKWDEDGSATPSPRRKALECGVAPKQEQDAVEVDDDVADADQLDKTGHGTASPEIGTRHVPDISADEALDEAEEAALAGVLDTIVPSLDMGEPDVPSIAITPSSPTSDSTRAMASPTGTPKRAASAQSAPNNYDDQDDQDDVAIARSTIAAVEPSLEEENAAYLWGFLSRTRARKEAKEQAEQEYPLQLEEATQSDSDEAEETASMYLENVPATIPEPKDNPTNFPPVNQPDVPLSPRRSSRLTTRLPIPQRSVFKPTATIALKRLNGAEFVAHNIETQSIAVATRQNTKSNKFGAIPVKIRLTQLTAEAKAREATATVLGTRDTSNEETTTPKRKKRKELVWAETLATYQDGSEPLQDSAVRHKEYMADIVAEVMPEEDGRASPEAGSEPEHDVNPNTETKQETLADQSIQGLFQMLKDKDKHNNRGGKKVRKLRRLNVGSVNGTPAPKKFTNTQLPVPVGSKIPTFGSSSSGARKAKSMDGAKAEENGSEAVNAEEGVQTRTRSRNLKSV